MQTQDNRQQRSLLNAETILKYFITDKSEIETNILAGSGNGIKLTTTDYSLYEALGSVIENDAFNWRKVVKFLEAVQIISFENVTGGKKPILTQKRVEEIRKILLKK